VTHVIIKDQLMGTGKSSKMIEEINQDDPDQRYIVVTPFLAECHRYAGTIVDEATGDYQKPKLDEKGEVIYTGEGCSASGRKFKHPQSGYYNKVQHIERLVEQGEDIVTTHTALKLFTPETKEAIKNAGYKLVIDEELECLKPVRIKKVRRNMLLNSGSVYLDENGLLRWSDDDKYAPNEDETDDLNTGLSWEMQIKNMCDNGSLVLVEDDTGERNIFMWEYPIEFIKSFDEIIVLTYMFEGSLFAKYLEFYKIPYHIERGIQIPSNPFDLINVIDNEKMNKVGTTEWALSATKQRSLKKESAVSKDIRRNLTNYFNNNTYGKTPMEEKLWTSLLESKKMFQGKGYTKRHIPWNTKAVNTYRGCSKLAYVYNPSMMPEQYKYLFNRGEDFAPSHNRHSLSEMLQWIYRSRVRQNEPITLYVPSSRMRGFLEDWMKGEFSL